MEKCELIYRTKEEIMLSLSKQMAALKILRRKKKDEVKIDLINKHIQTLEDYSSDVEDGRYYLVDKCNNTKIIVDFWKEYNSDLIEEVKNEHFHLIEVSYTDINDNEVLCLYDFNGNQLVRSCLKYDFVGKEIKVLQYGYMKDFHYDERNELFWAILASDNIIGKESIQYNDELEVFIVDDSLYYDELFRYLGKIDEKANGTSSYNLILLSEEGKYGVWSKGDYILRPEYDSIFYSQIGDFDIYYTRIRKTKGVFVYLYNNLYFKQHFESSSVKLIDVNFHYLLLNETIGAQSKLILIGIKSSSKTEFTYSELFQMDAPYLIDTIFCFINNQLNNTVLFLPSSIISSSFDDGHDSYFVNMQGVDYQSNVSVYLGKMNKYINV